MNDVKTVKILRDNAFCHAKWMDFKKVLGELPFGVFLEFVDPRNGKLVQQLFPFWCKPQKTYKPMGNVFMTHWQGLLTSIGGLRLNPTALECVVSTKESSL